MEIIWLPEALLDLHEIYEYHSEVAGEQVANGQLRKIYAATELLTRHPQIGHISSLDSSDLILEWVIPNTNYTLPYLIIDNEIQIYRVFDTRQELPESWEEQ